MEGGISIGAWMDLWYLTFNVTGMGVVRVDWPDGKSTIEQPRIAIEMLRLVGAQILAQIEESKHG